MGGFPVTPHRRVIGLYVVKPNRKALETLFQYSHEQGLASRKLAIEEVFHPSTVTSSEPA